LQATRGASLDPCGETEVDPDQDSGLLVRLDAPLPHEVAVGGGTALFVCGTCFHRDSKISSLSFTIDGVSQAVQAQGMPRLDVFRSLHPGLDPFASNGIAFDPESAGDPHLNSYLSGFWGIVEIGPGNGAPRELALRAELEDGVTVSAPLVSLVAVQAPDPIDLSARAPDSTAIYAPGDQGPLVAICMATYQAPIDLFERQIESIRSQTHRRWVCLISDDCSTPDRIDAMSEVLAGDPRFLLLRSPRRLGFYLNFERALAIVPPEAGYVALADQDDSWFPDKLEVLLAEIGDAQLVYSDARVVDREGALVSGTYWVRRRPNHTALPSLLMTNSVTGAASLFRRELLDYALPFPPAQFAHFHDHWIALVALALGDIEFVDRPLYDYVQHGEATLGHVAANWMPGLRSRLRSLTKSPRKRVVLWRHHYFVDACRLMVWATIVRIRCGGRMVASKRRALERFLITDRSLLALADLWQRGAGELLGWRSQTLGAEWMLAYAFTWRRLLQASIRERPVKGLRLDAVPPPALSVSPGRRPAESPSVRAIADKIAPLALSVTARAPRRVNLLIPSIDLEHLFGGYIGKFNLARRLAERGERVRIVTVDPIGILPPDFKRRVERYAGLSGLFDQVELGFGRETHQLECSPDDAFIATTWWTAHIARHAARAVGRDRFLYLIQEYEPFTFAMGSYAALARESYDFQHHALFSTELLRDYFRRNAIGVYEAGSAHPESISASFQNAIAPVRPPDPGELRARNTRRLLLYARPEAHASRNMFELGVLALQRALGEGTFTGGWELSGIGTLDGPRRLALDGGATLQLLPRSEEARYAELLRDYDVGLALMYTPHPSLVPIEMASAGMITVTNSFENKTQEAMSAISPNLLAPSPTIDAVSRALRTAADRVERYEERARGSAVAWSRDWNESFDDHLIARLIGWLH
jgi:glycosyltransferase involved in cell wall biosynthesis